MLSSLLKKVFGSPNERYVKKLQPVVDQINDKEVEFQKLSDEQLKAKTQEFKERLEKGEDLDSILVEAFATVKNACRRMCGQTFAYMSHEEEWNMIPYDVQLMGGYVMHNGGIAEMQTGEGKTLTASLPLYLNALTGKNCQLVTTNDYLALRDSEWIGAIFRYLGLTVGCVQGMMSSEDRREMYACNITYGTNSEFGFDYLRDMGMASEADELVQRDHFFVIVDEIDSILIDEARTPLIISGPVDVSTHRFPQLVGGIDKLFKMQRDLCNSMMVKIKASLTQEEPGSEAYDEAIFDLCKVRIGMPKNKQVLKILEAPSVRRFVDKQELKFHSDSHRGLLQEIKEELFFAIDEKQQDADLTTKGRMALNPSDPDAYVIPDIVEGMQEIDAREELSEEEKIAARQELQDSFEIKSEEIHNITQLLKAYCLYERDIQYVVADDKVIIVDEHTGRSMPGRRFSEGLHQALEAKEGVTIEKETQTLATITIQNYFRLYKKLGGMTGTAETEAGEFQSIYKLKVVAIPTNRPCLRNDENDRIFKTQREKYSALIQEIKEINKTGRPILVGTPTVEVSEVIGRLLQRERVPCEILNARRHLQEAEISAAAGAKGAITIATNMAGRGTDIKLGAGVAELGGLCVIGAARHDSRRIDRQLRGRCARQGDPGSTVFFISLEDDLMRLFGSDRITGVLERLGMKEGEQLDSPMLTKVIERAQKRVEQQNFAQRKRTLEYDDVMNHQRSIIYSLRKDVLLSEDPKSRLLDIVLNALEEKFNSCKTTSAKGTFFKKDDIEQWLSTTFPIEWHFEKLNYDGGMTVESMTQAVYTQITEKYNQKAKMEDPERIHWLERHIMLTAIDTLWKEHLHAMDHLRQSVAFAHMAQKDPLIEYKQQAFVLFDELTGNIAQEILNNMFRSATSLAAIEELLHSLPQFTMSAEDIERAQMEQAMMQMGIDPRSLDADFNHQEQQEHPEPVHVEQVIRDTPKVGRNEDCPCGSGKKYKKCCGLS
ncbi:MAG: preprotein translocase subunit SecA [Lentisphaeraceae bacterium]|nr:preprotein translocase subunit SecA [Lentisphaeraceae bacterium]